MAPKINILLCTYLEELGLLAQIVRLLPGGARRVGQLVVPLVPVRRLVPADGALAVGRHRAAALQYYLEHVETVAKRTFMGYVFHQDEFTQSSSSL